MSIKGYFMGKNSFVAEVTFKSLQYNFKILQYLIIIKFVAIFWRITIVAKAPEQKQHWKKFHSNEITTFCTLYIY